MGLWPTIFILLIYSNLDVGASRLKRDMVIQDRNVGTVLFDKSYLNNHCWSSEELAILRSREVFQDLLPKIEVITVQNDEYFIDLLKYLNTCFKQVYDGGKGKSKHLLLKSLADTVGGYIRTFVIPLSKLSFYSGNLRYQTCEKIYRFYDELKKYLHTDGSGWKEPLKVNWLDDISSFELSIQESANTCDQLIMADFSIEKHKQRRNIFHKRRCKFKSKKCHFRDRRRCTRNIFTNKKNHDTKSKGNSSSDNHQIYLPLLDSNFQPNSVALPFKNRTLWSLYDAESDSILLKYYEASVSCILSKSNFDKKIARFNMEFFEWLLQSIYPRLDDEKWYPAFGSILKVIQYLQHAVSIDGGLPDDIKVEETPMDYHKFFQPNSLGTQGLIILAIITAIVIWCIVGCTLLCYRSYLKSHSENCSPRDSLKKTSVLYKNVDYCTPDTCGSNSPRKCCSDTKISLYKPSKDRNRHTFIITSDEKRFLESKRRKKQKFSSVPVTPSSSNCSNFVNRVQHDNSDISSSTTDISQPCPRAPSRRCNR